jgi:hypothetical protein
MLEQPSGKTLRGPDYDIDLSTHKRLRSRSQNAGLPYVGPGRYIFHVQFRPHGGDEDWRDVAKVPLWVRVEYDSIIEEMAPPGGEYLQAAHSTGTIREA